MAARSRATEEQLGSLSSQFESIMAADREVCRQLRREVDEMQDELRHMLDLRSQVERQLMDAQQSEAKVSNQSSQLEGKLDEAKRRLGDVRESRRAMNLDSLSLRRDRTHCEEELAFLRRMAEDEAYSLEASRQANSLLEKSYQELEGHTEVLERQRRTLAQQVQQERDLVRQEERGSAALRNNLEQLRRQQATNDASRQEVLDRHQLTRDLQTLGRPAAAGRGMVQPPGGHSWAQNIAIKKAASPAAVSAS
mmetsp:Transcript_27226/g.76572  ORF Transcript_27226/g.76572 Transcript_27226/m.76572 type:complete len:252 (+) Transcript_27226:923-1678(+)